MSWPFYILAAFGILGGRGWVRLSGGPDIIEFLTLQRIESQFFDLPAGNRSQLSKFNNNKSTEFCSFIIIAIIIILLLLLLF
jgi:hypothetical protein